MKVYFFLLLLLHDGERVRIVPCLRESLALGKLLEVVIEDPDHIDSSKEQYVCHGLRVERWRSLKGRG